MKRTAGTLAIALALMATVACGGGDDDNAEADLERAVREYSEAFLAGDVGRSRELLSERCRTRIGGQLEAAVALAKEQYGPQTIRELTIDALDGDEAEVTYSYVESDLNQRREAWVREGGEWRNDDC